jgi:hypothetical protein
MCLLIVTVRAFAVDPADAKPATQPADEASHATFNGGSSPSGTAPWGVPKLEKHNRSKFMGTEGNGKTIVYLCDASGSMLSVFGTLKDKLKDSVNDLDPGQEFNVIFYSDTDSEVIVLFKDSPKPANKDNKKAAMDFINDAVSTGGTQPLPAIKAALAQKPDLIYLLTDGFDQIANFDDVTGAFKDGNPDGKMRVNCIFLKSDEDPKLEEALKKIAKDSQGEFKKISKSDM